MGDLCTCYIMPVADISMSGRVKLGVIKEWVRYARIEDT